MCLYVVEGIVGGVVEGIRGRLQMGGNVCVNNMLHSSPIYGRNVCVNNMLCNRVMCGRDMWQEYVCNR